MDKTFEYKISYNLLQALIQNLAKQFGKDKNASLKEIYEILERDELAIMDGEVELESLVLRLKEIAIPEEAKTPKIDAGIEIQEG